MIHEYLLLYKLQIGNYVPNKEELPFFLYLGYNFLFILLYVIESTNNLSVKPYNICQEIDTGNINIFNYLLNNWGYYLT